MALAALITACGDRPAGEPEDAGRDAANVPLVVQVEGLCEDTPLARYCWKELDDPAGCYFWTDDTDFKFGRMAWSGECSHGLAQGPGALAYISRSEPPYDWSQKGLMEAGKKHGGWIENSWRGGVREATYSNGKHDGKLLYRNRAGLVTSEYHYLDDKLHGAYVIRSEAGALLVESHYVEGLAHGEFVRFSARDGSILARGSYANGEREGPWLEAYADFILEGSYSNGLRSGEWVVRHTNGAVLAKGPYADGKQRGLWTYRYGDGSTSRGAYLGGERVGVWTVSGPGGSTRLLNYARSSNGTLEDGVPLVVRVEGRCGELPLGFPCWKELESPAQCYMWSSGQDPDQYVSLARMTWTGDCSNGIANGEGNFATERPAGWNSEAALLLREGDTAIFGSADRPSPGASRPRPGMEAYAERTVKRSHAGSFLRGRKHGEWKDRWWRWGYAINHYVNGLRSRAVTGNRRGIVTYEQNYVQAERHGFHAVRSDDGAVIRSGMYVEGEEDGLWIEPSLRRLGPTMEGTYADGLRDGEWTVTDGDGDIISRGPFRNGEPHGEWTYRFRNGFTSRGAFEHGERIGEWTVRDAQGGVTTVRYEDGQPLAPYGNVQCVCRETPSTV